MYKRWLAGGTQSQAESFNLELVPGGREIFTLEDSLGERRHELNTNES